MSLITINKTQYHSLLEFETPQYVLSSAVLNGGLQYANRVVNLKVSSNSTPDLTPQQSIQQYCNRQNWHGLSVGMMTAASMNSLRVERQVC
ncbi:hypothetical protein FLL46_01410 [Aliikangiella coralliicola]|uniref:Uncharacterized protein n=1 Tax=Aliikangiella coralliicola TaxID=2592383 RepID=A0A545UJD1_9GAMM|nr:hypothetical protein FLL46_01410 [Aliikangiella coralliicola]